MHKHSSSNGHDIWFTNQNGNVINLQKSKVYEDHFLFTHGVHEIDASAWASGMYVLELTTEGT
jgi:hypothetical protein